MRTPPVDTSTQAPRDPADSIALAVPRLAGNERLYMQQCLEDNFVSSVGPFVARFEREFADWVGGKYAVACVTGTAALHVALQLSGAKQGGTVAVSDLTFIASANAIAYTGATLLGVDSERISWNLDSDQLRAAVVRRADLGKPLPDVIQAVHLLGHPADLEPLMDLTERFGIPVVEDASEALGATYTDGSYAGRHVGTIGQMGCFSFNGNKIITSGGGGMIVTDDPDLAARAKHLTTTAKLPGFGYIHDEVAYNYRLTNVAAALGVAQLEQLEGFLKSKRSLARRYDEALADLPLTLPPRADWADPSFWLYSVLLDRDLGSQRDLVLQRLDALKIQARPFWPPLHQQAPYRQIKRLGDDVADDLYARGLSLPSSVGLSEQAQDSVVRALQNVLASL